MGTGVSEGHTASVFRAEVQPWRWRYFLHLSPEGWFTPVIPHGFTTRCLGYRERNLIYNFNLWGEHCGFSNVFTAWVFTVNVCGNGCKKPLKLRVTETWLSEQKSGELRCTQVFTSDVGSTATHYICKFTVNSAVRNSRETSFALRVASEAAVFLNYLLAINFSLLALKTKFMCPGISLNLLTATCD
jgi:hypothetical protein